MDLQEISDRLLILNRYAAYAHAVDSHDGDAYADCYTEDGWTDISSFRAMKQFLEAKVFPFMDDNGVIRGRANLRQSVQLLTLHHVTANVYIKSLSGDRATGAAHFIVFEPEDGGVEHYGVYEDELTRCADGQWRIVSRVDIARYERDRPLPALTQLKK